MARKGRMKEGDHGVRRSYWGGGGGGKAKDGKCIVAQEITYRARLS
jgi:hypothetical protein